MILWGQLGQLCKVYAGGGGIRNALRWGAGAAASLHTHRYLTL